MARHLLFQLLDRTHLQQSLNELEHKYQVISTHVWTDHQHWNAHVTYLEKDEEW
jgi:hypothetical protein